MSRLIDANALIEFFGRPEDDRDRSINHIIDKAPTIDAVEVVRCAECCFSKPIPEHAAKAFNAELVRDCTYQRGDWEQVYGFSAVSVDGYCDEGERHMDAAEEKDG